MNCKIHFSYCYTQNAFHVLSTVQGKGSFNTHCVCSQKGLILDILPIACVCVCVPEISFSQVCFHFNKAGLMGLSLSTSSHMLW